MEKRTGKNLRRHLALPLGLCVLAVLILGSYLKREPRQILRLGSLISSLNQTEKQFPTGVVTSSQRLEIRERFLAPHFPSLRLEASGDAQLVTFSWKLIGDPSFLPYRSLSFPVSPDGESHVYEINLGREMYWTGEVEALRIRVDQGTFRISRFEGKPPTSAYSQMSLHGETFPALPGLRQTVLTLPRNLPSGSSFEARLGLLPEYEKAGVVARFRVALEKDGAARPWIEETLEGGGQGGWRFVRRKLPWDAAGSQLRFEVEATFQGRPLPEGVAFWGNPLVVTPGKKSGPNLIVVLIDSLRADALGSYGNTRGLTPNLDRFARRSIRFTEMMTATPWTLPSVASLFTGLHAQTHGAGESFGNFAPTSLPLDARTLAEVLQEQGLYTLAVYHNIHLHPSFNLHQGFDEYSYLEEADEALVTRAIERLQVLSGDRRFFLYLHLFDPHNPYTPPSQDCRNVTRRLQPGYRGDLGCFADRRPENPPPHRADRAWVEALYHAEVASADREVGRLFSALDELDLAEDTVVAIVADHGEDFWSRIPMRAAGYMVQGDHGHSLYQELLHIPALLRIPGVPEAVVEGPAETADLFPTLLRAIGVTPPPSQGRDLTPRFTEPLRERQLFVYDRIQHGPPRWGVRRGPWKLIVPYDPALPLELYDLERDPGERRNLAASEPGVVTSLRALGEQERMRRLEARRELLGGENVRGATYLEWNHITKLRALGYLR